MPIVALLFLIPFYVWYAIRQETRQNDKLIAILEGDAQAAQNEIPQDAALGSNSGDREVHTWPFLMRMEFPGGDYPHDSAHGVVAHL